jgi:hypothetical protein
MKHRSGTFLVCIFGVIAILSTSLYASCQMSNPFSGEANARLYVLDLMGVSSKGVDNVTQATRGALDATSVNRTTLSPYAYGALNLSITLSIVHDWATYRTLIESDSNFIIVNAHGETLPVPTGYSREEWVNKIAEALAYRNVTWVHTALYPFYYSYDQISRESMWGGDGFKLFMSYIGKNNVTCQPTYPGREDDLVGLTGSIQNQLSGWSFDQAEYAQRGNPLHASDFNGDMITEIWSTGVDVIGAVIKFAASSNSSFGFYVHIGTRHTYNSTYDQIDGDYFRGYIGTAAALWAVSYNIACERAIADAATAIAGANDEGRTSGLGSATQYLLEAKQDFDQSNYISSFVNARNAAMEASAAVKPWDLILWPLLPIIAVLLALSAGAVLFVFRRKKTKKKKGSQESSRLSKLLGFCDCHHAFVSFNFD